MEANNFIAKLKADTAKECDLLLALDKFRSILGVLQKDRAQFSLNVLCVLCRNIDKVPKWRDSVDNKALLTMSIECVRETRTMERADRVKALACIYHVHKHIVKQNVILPPELVLKLSFMAFELDAKHLLNEYHKTYWNILVDRIEYIEKMKNRIKIVKLLPTITEHALKVVEIYDTVQFCSTVLIYLVKKLHQLYNEQPKELNTSFRDIFMKLTTKDMKPLKKLKENEIMEIYNKLSDCIFVVAENALKINFVSSPLDVVVRACMSVVSHCPDLLQCLQTIYLNTFCSILTESTNSSYTETMLNGLFESLETTEKRYKTAMMATYPFIKKNIRIFIEYNFASCGNKPLNEYFDIQSQITCLKLMLKITDKLRDCKQLLKCENCLVKTGLHDALRLTFQIKHFIVVPITQNIDINDSLPLIHEVIFKQYEIIDELRTLGCVNYDKCYQKLQSGTHNTAISLNKSGYYTSAIKLFELYVEKEFSLPKVQNENISRALFNKSICELEAKLYESAIIDAFLSLVLNQAQVISDKYMSLVIDIKAKEGKAKTDSNDIQLICVMDACRMAVDKNLYGNIKPLLKELNYRELVKHEFSLYAKLWPSLLAIAGVWAGLHRLAQGKYEFIAPQPEDLWVLYEVILETASVARMSVGEHLDDVRDQLIEDIPNSEMSPDLRIVYASLLLLKCESDLNAASVKYGWKPAEQKYTGDPDQVPANVSIPQEHAAAAAALAAVRALSQLAPRIHTLTNKKIARHSLQILQVFVQQLLQLYRRAPALQLAAICCTLADFVNDDEAYVRNAGTLLYHDACLPTITQALNKAKGLAEKKTTLETAIMFVCDYSIYFSGKGRVGIASSLVQLAQGWLFNGYNTYPDINLELGVGRLLEAQQHVCKSEGPSLLSAVNNLQRHYLSTPSTGTGWSGRRLRALSLRVQSARASQAAAGAARSLLLWRRARGAVAAAPTAAATYRASMYALITDVSSCEDAQIKIDNRLKHFLGLQPSNETQPYYTVKESKKQEKFAPKQEIETMLESLVLRKSQTSPSIPCTAVPAFKVPEFFNHNETCSCYACDIPICYILACQTSGLEASVYFRANENIIARNYFNGVIKMINKMEERLKIVRKKMVYDDYVVEAVMKHYWNSFRKVHVEILIELAFFELRNKDFDVADEVIVEIHEVMRELKDVDEYMSDSVANLMVCSAQLRNVVKKPDETGLEAELESLKLSPNVEPPKTPVNKAKIPAAATNKIVKGDEVPKKRKVIKLNLDDDNNTEVVEDMKPKKVSPEFKMPVLKHVLEAATPKTVTKPRIVITEHTNTPIPDCTTFFTPKETPEQFFTPLTSVKTYKRSLRHNIAKNLEHEFSTPTAIVTDRKNDKSEVVKVNEGKVKDLSEVKAQIERKESVSLKDNQKQTKIYIADTETTANDRKSIVKRIPRIKTLSQDKVDIMKENLNDNADVKSEPKPKSVRDGRKISKLVKGKVTSQDDDFEVKESTKIGPSYLTNPSKLNSIKDSKTTKDPKIEEPTTTIIKPVKTENTKVETNVAMDYLGVPKARKKEAVKKLKRATSPGKLPESERSDLPRPRRLKKPMSYCIDDKR